MELVRALELESVDGDGRIASEIGMVVGRETRWWPFIVWRRRSRFRFWFNPQLINKDDKGPGLFLDLYF